MQVVHVVDVLSAPHIVIYIFELIRIVNLFKIRRLLHVVVGLAHEVCEGLGVRVVRGVGLGRMQVEFVLLLVLRLLLVGLALEVDDDVVRINTPAAVVDLDVVVVIVVDVEVREEDLVGSAGVDEAGDDAVEDLIVRVRDHVRRLL